jgi:dipeptidyl aminopeptidase/acylaminoacyl peptidase
MTGPAPYCSVARAWQPTPGPAGDVFFASDLAGLPQIYRLAGPDRFPVRLAPSQDRTLPVACTERGLLVRSDRGGDEIWQLGLLDEQGLRPASRDPLAIHRDVTPAPDGRRAGLAYNPRGQADWVLGVLDLETGHIEHRVDRGGYWRWLAWSPDGATAAVTEQKGLLLGSAYLLHGSGELEPVLPDARRVTSMFWAADRLFALTDRAAEFVGLAELDPADPSRLVRWLIAEDHDVLAAVPDPAGRRAAVIVNRGANDELRLVDLAGGAAESPGTLPPGVVYSDNASETAGQIAWLPDGDRLLVAWESPTAPAELVEVAAGTPWTRAAGAPLPGLVAPRQVEIPAPDGERIPALHFRVAGSEEARPTVVYFHGGPESQARGNYSPAIAVWNAAGFDVLAPNVRGSTGYGARYYSLDDRELRWDAVRDGCACGRWLRDTGAASRLVAMGGSYGGFMTLAVLVEDPALWDAAVDLVGIADWHTFLGTTSGWRRAIRVTEYGEPDGPDGEFLARFSPLRSAAAIRAHLLIVHGRNDPRVPLAEAEQMHRAVPGSELLVFDDEGHGITRLGNRVRAYGRALEFVRERLRD